LSKGNLQTPANGQACVESFLFNKLNPQKINSEKLDEVKGG